jgi:peptide-methionine (S)-S-oxide reductase
LHLRDALRDGQNRFLDSSDSLAAQGHSRSTTRRSIQHARWIRAKATYRNHGTHAEAIEIIFDPARVSYRDLLEFVFQIHDPTTKNRQGNDIGMSYRSAIFYTSDEQKRIAEETIADVDASGLWPGKVVTEVAAAGPFWEAEPEHQDYLERYPNGYTCHYVRPQWRLPRRHDSADAVSAE